MAIENKLTLEVEVMQALKNYPYFVLSREQPEGTANWRRELIEIKKHYINYRKGARFYPEGSAGDYIPSSMQFKLAKTLIDKEARFMFSQTPDIHIESLTNDNETEQKQAGVYKKIVDEVMKKSNLSSYLLQAAKDCFIGKRVAYLVDVSERDGIRIHFYNSLQFYYETEYGSDRLTKFISFETVNEARNSEQRLFLVNRYEEVSAGIYMSSILYDGMGKEVETLISETKIALDRIPAGIIINDGTLEDKRGISEVESLAEYEAGYSRLANADVDSERKGMNPIRYVVDMNTETTKGLSSGAGSFWEMKSEQNQDNVHPMVGVLAPAMNHTEPVKTTLDRIRSMMFGELDIPDITEDGLLSGVTSYKAVRALYFPLSVRCDEKLKTWKPALENMVNMILDFAILNPNLTKTLYLVSDVNRIQYQVRIEENYALLEDETEEKQTDMQEIATDTRSRVSYMKKWRTDLKTDADREAELLQIAMEKNMVDTMSMNTQVQTELNKKGTEAEVQENIEQIETETKLEEQNKE